MKLELERLKPTTEKVKAAAMVGFGAGSFGYISGTVKGYLGKDRTEVFGVGIDNAAGMLGGWALWNFFDPDSESMLEQLASLAGLGALAVGVGAEFKKRGFELGQIIKRGQSQPQSPSNSPPAKGEPSALEYITA